MMMLEDKLFRKLEAFNSKAEHLIENEEFSQAITEYQKAWNTLPEPKQLWDAALWIKLGQAECLLTLDDFNLAKEKLLEAIICSGAINNPLVHLLLGICCFELEDTQCARDELQLAYDLEGESVFQEGDEKYRQFLFERSH